LRISVLPYSPPSRRLSRRKGLGSEQPILNSVWHTGLSGGAPDSVRCARLNSGEQAALGKIWRRMTIIHRTVRWCTGLSDEPTAASATVSRAIRGQRMAHANGRQGAPDCLVCIGQCPVRQLPRRCNSHLRQIRKEIRTGHATVTVRWCTGLSGGAPDCPVHHPTEGNFGLPCWPPTAPSCLGAIKGTSRRMEESPKHTLSIPRLLVLTFTQSFIVLEIGALFEL
jgi:hypothetical protein